MRKAAMFMLACVLAAALLPAALAQDQYTLKYAPKVGATMSYEASISGEAAVSLMGGVPIPITANLGFDVTPSSTDDKGVVTETLAYTSADAEAMDMPFSSQYVGTKIEVKREPDGAWAPGGQVLPPPDMNPADILIMFGQLPRLVRFPKDPVKVGDEWTIERQPLPPFFGSPKPEGQDGTEAEALSKTFIEQRCKLTAVKDFEGRKAAVIMCEMKITMEGEEIFPGQPVDAQLAGTIELAVYSDTGELIVSDIKCDDSWLKTQFQGADVEIKITNMKGRFKIKGADVGDKPEQPAQPQGGDATGNKRPGT